MASQSQVARDTRWWEPVIPLIEDPEGKGRPLLSNLPLDVQSYLRILGQSNEAEHDSDTGRSEQPESELMAAGMKLLAAHGKKSKSSWAETRLQGLRVLEEQSWPVWFELFCQTYLDPLPYVTLGEHTQVLVSNLRVPLPLHMTMSILEALDQEVLEKFTRDRHSSPYHPGLGRCWGEFDMYSAFGVRFSHTQHLYDDGLLPVPSVDPRWNPERRERAERRFIDMVPLLEAQRSIEVLRVNHLDDPVRLLVVGEAQTPPSPSLPAKLSSRWRRNFKIVFKLPSRRQHRSEQRVGVFAPRLREKRITRG